MMKYLETRNCTAYKVNANHLVYIKDGYMHIYPDKTIKGEFVNLTLDDYFIYTYDIGTCETVFYDIGSLKKIYCSKDFLSIIYDADYRKEKKYLFGQYRDSENKYWVFVNAKQFSVEQKYKITIENRYLLLISDFSFIFKDNEKILLKRLDNNVVLWQHSFSELLPPIQTADNLFQNGNMIIHNGCLYFSLFENNRHLNTATICIDIETGKVENIFKGFAGNLSLFGNNIGIVSNETVQILNTETNKIETLNVSSILKPHNLSISWNGNIFTEDGLLYFRGDSKVGIIDLDAKELLWHTSFDISKLEYNINQQIMDIQLHSEKLYIHCSDNTLHIFENEK